MTRFWLTLICVLLNAPLALRAQDTLLVRPGTRVRARTKPDSHWQVGRFVAYGPDSLWLIRCRSCAADAYALSSLRAFEVSVGRSPRLGTVLGSMFGGAVVGSVLGFDHGRRATRHCGDAPCLAAAVEPLIGGFVGVVAGFAIGVSIRYDQWRPALIVSRPPGNHR